MGNWNWGICLCSSTICNNWVYDVETRCLQEQNAAYYLGLL